MKKIFTILGLVAIAATANAQIVISEVYGGGGGATAVFANDFVELKNIGTTSETLTNATLQYASANGNFNSYATLPTITLAPGQKYLIEMVPTSPATAGAALPTADYQITNNTSFSNGTTYNGGFAMAAGSGKIALANGATQVTTANGANVIDFVGYGTASMYEGAGAAPTLDASTSATRTAGDTNNNAADFAKLAPSPENSTLAVSDVTKGKAQLVKASVVKDQVTFVKGGDVQIINAAGQVVKSAKVADGSSLNVSTLAKGTYIVVGTVNGEKVSQKVIKQ